MTEINRVKPKTVMFAGGGTGGHIYPAIAIAEKLKNLDSSVKIYFLVSERAIDSEILSKTDFGFTKLPAVGLSVRPVGLLRFFKTYFTSRKIVEKLLGDTENAVMVGVGGFVAAPACHAAYRKKVPVKLVNVDFIPGKANKFIAKFSDEIYTFFDETSPFFGKNAHKTRAFGCPLRGKFANPDAQKARDEIGIDFAKKTLLITGASSGSARINETICSLAPELAGYADTWQIVHLTGKQNYQQVVQAWGEPVISVKVLDYYHDLPNLLAASDLLIGRSGAVSVAEYAAAGVPSICMPYPHHADMHQYLNASKLVEVGAAVIVDDVADAIDRRGWLWEVLEPLLKDDSARNEMKAGCAQVARPDAAENIAKQILDTRN